MLGPFLALGDRRARYLGRVKAWTMSNNEGVEKPRIRTARHTSTVVCEPVERDGSDMTLSTSSYPPPMNRHRQLGRYAIAEQNSKWKGPIKRSHKLRYERGSAVTINVRSPLCSLYYNKSLKFQDPDS